MVISMMLALTVAIGGCATKGDLQEVETREKAIATKADQAAQDAQDAKAAADEAVLRAKEAAARTEEAAKNAEEREKIAADKERLAEEKAMEFRTFTNRDIGVSGLVPEGWEEKGSGEFLRGASETDRTALIQQGIPGVTVEQLKGLLSPKLGIEKFPERIGGITTRDFSWNLYTIDCEDPNLGVVKVDIALAQEDEAAFMVLFQTTSDEYDHLHYSVFARAVDALVPTSSSKVEKPSQDRKKVIGETGAEVLLVKGDKLENQASDIVAEILRKELSLSTGFVDLEALGEVDFGGVKLIYFPGGEYLSIRLSKKALGKVQSAVASGTGYIGTCCGALLAAESTTMSFHWNIGGDSFGIFPGIAETAGGEGVWPFYIDVHNPILSNSSVAENISPMMKMRFVGGTSNIVPSYERGLKNWRVATLDKPSNSNPVGKRAVMTATVFGKGRVFLSGPHPEAQEDTYSLILAAAEWCTHRSDPETDERPVVETEIPSEGLVNHFFLCSAIGSHDPMGFPVGFIWDFGDGSPKQYRPEAVHLYKGPGKFTVTLTVTTGTRYNTRSVEVNIHKI